MSERKDNPHKKKKILFFTPYSGRTGSEIMLYSILRNLDAELFEIKLISLRNGELVQDRKNNFSIHTLDDSSMFHRTENFIRKKVTGITNLEKNIIRIHHDFNPDIWYLNTIVMPEVAEVALKNNIPFAVHFHELQTQFNLVNDHELEMQVNKSAFNVGCSRVVCDAIRMMSGREPELMHECIDLQAIQTDDGISASFRAKNNIPADHRIVIMSGQRSEIKGLDIFLQVAEQFRGEKIHFVWLGASKHSGYNFYYEKFAEQVKEMVTFAYPNPDEYYSILNAADLFFLSSRSDPFPLVMVEAAFLGKYIVALDSGGVVEFCEGQIGTIIRHQDIADIISGLRSLLKTLPESWNPSLSKQRAVAFDVKTQAQKLSEILLRKLS